MSIFDRFRKPEEGKEAPSRAPSPRELLASFTANIEEDQRRYPEDSAAIAKVFEVLKGKHKSWCAARGGNENASASFFLSEDKMRAYACVFPPQGEGADVNVEGFLSRMNYEGISYGVLQEELQRNVEGKNYFHVFPIANGTAPVDGTDGTSEDLFPRRPAPNFAAADESVVDFSPESEIQPVHAGDTVCRLLPPVPGRDGTDVTGSPLPCRSSHPVSVLTGENLRLSEDGLSLLAAVDGVLDFENGQFRVRPCMLVDGDLKGEEGGRHVEGSLCVTGDVRGDAVVQAAGDVYICGEVLAANITAGGGIRVQKGIHGVAERTFLRSGGQLQAAVIETAVVDAGGSVFAEAVTGSAVSSGGTVNALGGQGLIAGGQLQVMHRVVCRRIGAGAGARTSIMVGCDPQIVAEWEQNKNESAKTQKVMDKLWENIGALRKTEAWLNDEQKDLLQKLLEQRTLYEEKRSRLKEEREVLRQQMRASRSGRVKCHELFPVLEIRLGERKGEVKTHEMECDIHLREDNAILMR